MFFLKKKHQKFAGLTETPYLCPEQNKNSLEMKCQNNIWWWQSSRSKTSRD